jgi:hypothetical protein
MTKVVELLLARRGDVSTLRPILVMGQRPGLALFVLPIT